MLVAKGNAEAYLGHTPHHLSREVRATRGIAQILGNPPSGPTTPLPTLTLGMVPYRVEAHGCQVMPAGTRRRVLL